ncbi:cell wall-binding repeat-containing protein [Streptomyces sp. NPDC002004]
MNRGMRRGLAALGTAVAMAGGALATAPGAAAAGPVAWQATDGKLAYTDAYTNYLVAGTASELHGTELAYGAKHPAWSPDGSRVAYVNKATGRVETRRYTGSTPVTIEEQSSGTGAASEPTFWYEGQYVVYTADGRLRYARSDGARYAEPLLATDVDGCDKQPSGAVNGLLAFVRTGTSCGTATGPVLMLLDGDTGTIKKLAAGGEDPDVSPDGTQVAFVRSVDGVKQLFTIGVDGTGEKQLSHGTTSVRNPSWSGTGTRIAFNDTGSGTDSATQVADVATGTVTPPAHNWGADDVAWQRVRKNSTVRVWGADAYGTNVTASKWTWNTVGQSRPGMFTAKSAVLVGKDSPSYALTAPALAGEKSGPVLMTPKSSVSSAVQAELKRTLKRGSTVYLVGGTDILGSAVASKVSALGFTPKRLADTSRYSTSVKVAKAITSSPGYVFLATGNDYHSALAASAAAGALGSGGKAVVVLNDDKKLSSSVRSYLDSVDPERTMVIPVGSSAKYALTHTSFPHWPNRWHYYPVSGTGHDGTSVALAKLWWSAPNQAGLARTDSWRGGLSAATGMYTFGPVLWTDETTPSDRVASYLRGEAASANLVIAFGGTGSVSRNVLDAAGSAISPGASRFTYRGYYEGAWQGGPQGLRSPQAERSPAPRTAGADPVRPGAPAAPLPDLSRVRTAAGR